MRISYFKEFIVLAKCLNFSLAARQLHMTQPGLSRHISALEGELGVKLFQRDTHVVRLTENGALFLEGIQKIVEDYDFLCQSVSNEGLKKITIGVPYYGVDKYLSRNIVPFESAYANVQIDFFPSYPDEIIAALLSMRVDVAVLPKVSFLHFENLAFTEAFEEPVAVMLNRSHPLAQKSGVWARELLKEHYIKLKGHFGNALFEEFRDFCRQHGFAPPEKTREADSIEAAALSIKPEGEVMLLPGHLIAANISGKVKFIRLLDEACTLEVCLVHNPANHNPVIAKFISHYLSVVRSKK